MVNHPGPSQTHSMVYGCRTGASSPSHTDHQEPPAPRAQPPPEGGLLFLSRGAFRLSRQYKPSSFRPPERCWSGQGRGSPGFTLEFALVCPAACLSAGHPRGREWAEPGGAGRGGAGPCANLQRPRRARFPRPSARGAARPPPAGSRLALPSPPGSARPSAAGKSIGEKYPCIYCNLQAYRKEFNKWIECLLKI